MTEFFQQDPEESEWALPGDQATLEALKPAEETPAVEDPLEADREATNDQPAETEAAVEEPAADERPRDDQGRFVSTKEETEPERDLAAEIAALEKRLEDKDAFIGRQSNELGELRSQLDERFAKLDERLAAPQHAPVQITQEMVDENPAAATQLAFEQQNPTALQIAFESWKTDDPAAAGAWLAGRQADQRIAELERAHAEQIAALEARIAPLTERTDQAQLAETGARYVEQNPGLLDFINGEAIGTVAAEFPKIGEQIATGATPNDRFEAIKALYEIHRARSGDTLKVSTGEIARATAEEAQKAREEAFVASATTTSTGTKPSIQDQIAAEWEAEDAVFENGWNV